MPNKRSWSDKVAPFTAGFFLGGTLLGGALAYVMARRNSQMLVENIRAAQSGSAAEQLRAKTRDASAEDVRARAAHDPVLVLWHATWCPMCTQTYPVWIAVESMLQSKVHVVKISTDDTSNHPLAREKSVTALPTIMLFKRGGATEVFSGARTAEAIVEWATGLLSSSDESDAVAVEEPDSAGAESRVEELHEEVPNTTTEAAKSEAAEEKSGDVVIHVAESESDTD